MSSFMLNTNFFIIPLLDGDLIDLWCCGWCRTPRESCTVSYPDQGSQRVMHSELPWSGVSESHAQ